MEWPSNWNMACVVAEGQVLKQTSGGGLSHQSLRIKHENDRQRHRCPLPYMKSHALLSLLIFLMPLLGTAFAQERSSLLVVDTRSPPPVVPHVMQLLQHRRDNTPASTCASTRASPSKRSIDTDTSTTTSDFTIPTPFDTSLSNNFTTSCAKFFQQTLMDTAFNDCHPFSLLLQTSDSFFEASKSFVRITQTLEATCAANLPTCRNIMEDRAQELISNNYCGVDYANDNPQVLQAYNGLLAYEPLYKASCLLDAQGSFCYANAVTNSSATTDSYPYYLPLGVSLPGGARPTCNSCLQNALAIFSSYASNSTQPVSKTYNAAAQQVDEICGPTFVNKTSVPLKGAASGTSATFIPTMSLLIIIFYFFQ